MLLGRGDTRGKLFLRWVIFFSKTERTTILHRGLSGHHNVIILLDYEFNSGYRDDCDTDVQHCDSRPRALPTRTVNGPSNV